MSWKVEQLIKRYEDRCVVDQLHFDLEQGQCLALLGRNGAGKSTTIRMLTSLLQSDQGAFLYEGVNLFGQTKRLRQLVGYVSQELALDKTLTAVEFMKFHAGLYHLRWREVRERAAQLLDAVSLSAVINDRIQTYSGGMKRRLDLAAALLNQPKLLILDEPTSGLDVEGREQIWSLVREFKAGGGSVLLASHDFSEVAALADLVLVMDDGKTLKLGPLEQLKAGLGDFVAQIRAEEIMQDARKTEINAALTTLDGFGESLNMEDSVQFTLRGTGELDQAQHLISDHFSKKGISLNSLRVQKPTVEDVYRFAVGGGRD